MKKQITFSLFSLFLLSCSQKQVAEDDYQVMSKEGLEYIKKNHQEFCEVSVEDCKIDVLKRFYIKTSKMMKPIIVIGTIKKDDYSHASHWNISLFSFKKFQSKWGIENFSPNITEIGSFGEYEKDAISIIDLGNKSSVLKISTSYMYQGFSGETVRWFLPFTNGFNNIFEYSSIDDTGNGYFCEPEGLCPLKYELQRNSYKIHVEPITGKKEFPDLKLNLSGYYNFSKINKDFVVEFDKTTGKYAFDIEKKEEILKDVISEFKSLLKKAQFGDVSALVQINQMKKECKLPTLQDKKNCNKEAKMTLKEIENSL